MSRSGSARRWAASACLLAIGCSAAREIPRGEYAAHPERKNVRVDTRSGDRYEFERIQIRGDSLHGGSRIESEGPFEEFRSVSLPLDEVLKLSVRSVDWYRTGLILGVAAAVGLAAVLSQTGSESSGDAPGPCGPRPCP